MSAKFFRLTDTDQCPYFEQTSQFSGKILGVAMVEVVEEQDRLIKRGCVEITQAEYDATTKKKRDEQDSLGLWRPVIDSSEVGILLAAKPVAPVGNFATPPRQEHIVDNVIKPSKSPIKRK